MFITIFIGVVCVIVVLARWEKELLQRVLFWAGVALGIFALTLLVASRVYPA